MMENRPNLPPFRTILAFSIFLFAVGVVGLVVLFSLTTPTLGPRWLMFFLTTFGAAGVFLPLAYFLHLRFPNNPPADGMVLIREALFFSAYCDFMLWLKLGGVLNFAMVVFIFIGFVAIELIVRLRERSKWNPQA
jgi:hypothetical protein